GGPVARRGGGARGRRRGAGAGTGAGTGACGLGRGLSEPGPTPGPLSSRTRGRGTKGMAEHLVIYTVVHQPRRLRLPARPIPPGATPTDIARCLFDEPLNERYFRKVARTCYWPTTQRFAELVEQGLKLSIGFSLSFVRQAETWDPMLLAQFRQLVAHPNVELI